MSSQDTFNPFPGLRPFQIEEKFLFFGREEQTSELLTRLRKTRFLAVVGVSGSGKSSLVRAGLLPELHGGTMATAGSSWEVAVMRPGGDPLTNLAEALIDADIHDSSEEHIASHLRATLGRSGKGLVEAIKQGDLPERTNLLLVVDQFEEIFRFRRMSGLSEEEAGHFITLLLEASEQANCPVYVVLTMRSDFLGDCAQFRGLAEAVNEGEYLIPRLNRNQRRQAIEGPVAVGGREINNRLTQRLLNDIGDDPDQLPILQHALMRTWDYWEACGAEGPIDLEHYQATGGMSEALSRHADEVHAELPDDEHRWISEKLFKALTERVDQSRGIRRPMQMLELCNIIEREETKLRTVIDYFRAKGRTFLMPSGDSEITPKTVIDISHESLMRAWHTLSNWVEDEAQSAKIYRRLADTASLFQDGKAGLYRDPDLQIALSWRLENQPNRTWADHYYAGFDEAMGFLDKSQDEAHREEREREEARIREIKQAKALAEAEQAKAEAMLRLATTQKRRAILATVLLIISIASTIFASYAWKQARENEKKAILSLVSQQKLLKDDVSKALDILDKGGENNLVKFAETMRQKSQTYAKVGDFESALIAVNAAVKINSTNKNYWLYAGRINSELGNNSNAISNINSFVELTSDEDAYKDGWPVLNWTFGASVIAKTDSYYDFTNFCYKAISHIPYSTTNYYTIGERLAKGLLMLETTRHIHEIAEEHVMQSISIMDENTKFYDWTTFTAGLAKYRKRDLKSAEKWSLISLQKSPKNHNYLQGLNNALLSLIYFRNEDIIKSNDCLEIAKTRLDNIKNSESSVWDILLIELLIKERLSLN